MDELTTRAITEVPGGPSAVARAVKGVERAIDKLIPLLAVEDLDQSRDAALALLNLGAMATARLVIAAFKTEGVPRRRIIHLLAAIGTVDGASVLPALRQLLEEDLDPLTCAEVRTAFLVALKQAATLRQAAMPAGLADG